MQKHLLPGTKFQILTQLVVVRGAMLRKAAEEKAHRAHRVAAAPTSTAPAATAPAPAAESTEEEKELETAHYQIKTLEHQLYKKAKKASDRLHTF